MITQNSCMKYLVGSVSVLAIALAVGCSQKKKNSSPPVTPGPDATAGLDPEDDSQFEAPEPRSGEPDASMTELSRVTGDIAKEVKQEANEPDTTPEQRDVLNGIAEGLGQASKGAAALAESGAEAIGAACAGAGLAVLSLGGNLEVKDKGKSWAWLGWTIVGGALIGAGFNARTWGVRRIEAAMARDLGGEIADLSGARKMMLSGGNAAQNLRLFYERKAYAQGQFGFMNNKLNELLDTENKRIAEQLLTTDGRLKPAAIELFGKDPGTWAEGLEFKKKFAALAGADVDVDKIKGIQTFLASDVTGAPGAPRTPMGEFFFQHAKEVSSAAPSPEYARAVGAATEASNSRIVSALMSNKTRYGVMGAGALAVLYGGYRAAYNDSLKLTDTSKPVLADDQMKLIEKAAAEIEQVDKCDQPLEGEEV